MNGNSIGVVVVLIVIIIGGWFMFSGKPATSPSVSVTEQMPIIGSTTTETVATGPSQTLLPMVTVTYTDTGFSPKNVEITAGRTVNFINQSSGKMWVASAVHPAHSAYSGTSLSQHCPDTTNTAFDECAAVESGNAFAFTFDKVGVWKYHNHAKASDFGSVTVTAQASTTTPSPI